MRRCPRSRAAASAASVPALGRFGGRTAAADTRRLARARAVPLSVAFVALAVAAAAPLLAAPPPPPGGHHPIRFGGDNRPGYPPLSQPVAVPGRGAAPDASLIVTVHPNPFRTATRLRFVTRPGERVRVRVFTAHGRSVRDLMAPAGAGAQQVVCDGRDHRGRRLPPGVYLYRVEAGSRAARGRFVLVR